MYTLARPNHFHPRRYDPFREMEELERMLFTPSFRGAGFRTDITDNGDAYSLEADLPGFGREDITVEVQDNCLTISAERKEDSEHKEDGGYVRRERRFGSFRRSFDITGIRGDEISAKYENGVLTLSLPKEVPAEPEKKRIEIL